MISQYNEKHLPGCLDYNSEQIQNAYRLAYFLHPQDDVALNVLKEGFDKARLLVKTISKRPPSDQPHKLATRNEDLLHVGVMLASELFEIYQEMVGNPVQRKLSRYANTYQPTLDDFIIRYVKAIYKNSHDRTARYLAIGVGTLVYRYKTIEILGISDYFDNNNSSKIKKYYENVLAGRFPTIDLRQFLAADERIVKLIECCFDIFTLPSIQNIDFSQVSNVRNEYFSYQDNKPERDKLDVLMKFGLCRLIAEYNNYVPYGLYALGEPNDKLILPQVIGTSFNQSDQNIKNRLEQSKLSEKEAQMINTFLRRESNIPAIKLTTRDESGIDHIFNDHVDGF